jgi:phage-related protein (TIGR01555 family)
MQPTRSAYPGPKCLDLVGIGFLQDTSSTSEWRLDGALINVLTGLGTSKDRNEAIGVKRSRILSETAVDALYEQSWLIRRIVEKLPQQGTRSGWDLSVGDEASSSMKAQLDDVVGWTEKLHLRQNLAAAATYARLYGGGALVLIADDRTPIDKPLNLKRLRTIYGFYPIDRWRLYPASGWSGVGQPESYWFWTQHDRDLQQLNDQAGNKQVTSGGLGLTEATQVEIHSSRVIRIEGLPCSWRSQQERQWWGVSVVDLVWDCFKRWETGQQSAADILHDFDLVVHKLPGLSNMLAAGGEQKLRARLQANALARSTLGVYLLDAGNANGVGEEITNFTRSAAGIADIITNMKSEITGASGLPHTLLWGESPSGLGADGRSEQAAFGNEVADWQAQHLKEPLRRVYELVLACSDGPWKGKEPPDDWEITFRPTYSPTEDEQAELRQKVAAADSQYIQTGVLQPNEVALSRFGKPRFSLDTTLLNREADGSIPEPEQPEEVEFGGALAEDQPTDLVDPAAEEEEDPALSDAAAAPPRTDAADEACCPACEERAQELAEQITSNRARRKRRRDEEPRNDAEGSVVQLLGVSVRMDGPGIGRLLAPYGQTLPYPVAVGPDLSGAWEVFEPSSGAYLLALGHQHMRGIRDAVGTAPTIRRLDAIDLVAMGAVCDAYVPDQEGQTL